MKKTALAKPAVIACAGIWALLLSGCDKEATGQVAAVVNGEEITLQEINATLAEANIPEGADKKVLQQQALQQIIERRLVAQEARKDNIDKDPNYLIKQRQLGEALLIQMYAQKTGATLKVPDQAAIQKYVTSHPFAFSDRTIYSVDQIVFLLPSDATKLKSLEKANSLDEIAKILDSMGTQYQRGGTQMDSAQVPPAMMSQISSLPAGEPFIIPTGVNVTANVITGSKKVPVNDSETNAQVVNDIRKDEMTKIMQERLKSAKAQADIKYQNGFAPPAQPADSKALTTSEKPAG